MVVGEFPWRQLSPYLKKIDLAKMLGAYDAAYSGDKNQRFSSFSGSFILECLVKYFMSHEPDLNKV